MVVCANFAAKTINYLIVAMSQQAGSPLSKCIELPMRIAVT
jgi:hypothetical protein